MRPVIPEEILDPALVDRVHQAAWPNMLNHPSRSPVYPGGYTIKTDGVSFLRGGARLTDYLPHGIRDDHHRSWFYLSC